MTDVLLAGIVAGLGVAVPVGAIAVLIIETGLRRGFAPAAAAGAGAATVDGLYATLAALFGGALAALIAPWSVAFRLASAAVLALIAARLLLDGLRRRRAAAAGDGRVATDAAGDAAPAGSLRRTYLTFVGLTGVNPATLVYFAALIVGLPDRPEGVGEQLVFAAGAFGASLLWQLLIAAVGAVGHRRLPASLRAWTTVLGGVIVLLLAATILLDVVRGPVG